MRVICVFYIIPHTVECTGGDGSVSVPVVVCGEGGGDGGGEEEESEKSLHPRVVSSTPTTQRERKMKVGREGGNW